MVTSDQQRLRRCLNPESIAVVGGKEADRVVEQCLKLGFEGAILPINPRRKTMQGLPCFNSLAQLLDQFPGTPDVTFVAIPAESSIEIIKELNIAGAGGAICYSSGFREVGDDGFERHNRLLEVAAGMPVFGPNCHGYINTLSGAALWPDQHGLRRNKSGVAIFSCSGNVSINFTLQQRGLAIAWLVTVGNQAVMGIEQGIAAALDNDKITAIGIHIEGLNNLPLFIELAHRARLKGIPIIALKTGKSVIGARTTMSHTATLAGESGLYTALFARLGIGQVDTIEAFLEALKLVSVTGALAGNNISSMSCSGGEAALIADLSEAKDIHFPPVEAKHKKKLQDTLKTHANEYINVDNPLDYHTFIWGDQQRLTATFSAMMDGKYDLNLLIIDIPHMVGCNIEEWDTAIQAFIDASRQTGGKAVIVSSMSETLTDSVRERLLANGIAPLQGMQQALVAIEAAYHIGRVWAREWLAPKIQVSHTAVAAHQVYGLDEYQAKQLLKQAGISVPASSLVSNQEQACRAATEIGYPLVLKAVASEIAHKSELNAVVVGINSAQQLKQQVKRLLKISDSLLVEEMVDDVVAELLIGVSFDQQFGNYLVVGFGGTLVELIGDREILLLPVCRDEVIRALKKLKTWPLLNGFRGRALADVDKVVDTVLSIADFVEQKKAEIVELEINPLMVKGKHQGVVAADVLMRMRSD